MKEKPINLVLPSNSDDFEKFFKWLFDAHKDLEEFGATVDILRAEHYCAVWLAMSNVPGVLTQDKRRYRRYAAAWLKWSVRK